MENKLHYKILLAWIGLSDIRASQEEVGKNLGPIANAVCTDVYTHIFLLSNHDKKIEKTYSDWIQNMTKASVKVCHTNLTGPTEFGEIYEAAVSSITSVQDKLGKEKARLTYHLSPGTSAMAAVWIILAKTAYPAELIESSSKWGVRVVSLPFDISADYLPNLPSPSDGEIIRLTQGLPPKAPEFDSIICRCKSMERLVAKARRIAVHNVPILIQGESGTGKELFARAIHASSARHGKPFIAVNCGAIPAELFEAEFFGHAKGAFTGAVKKRDGYLEVANGGTLFLDEVGELPVASQVKLLRALQEGIIHKIGSTEPIGVDVRVIAATNKNLLQEVTSGNFREDLFHRLAVGVLHIPPLRERHGDLGLLIDYTLGHINRDCVKQEGWKHKKLSAGAKNLLIKHYWPGNVRELVNTLSRAVIWVTEDIIRTADIQEALFPVGNKEQGVILNRSLGNGLNLPQLLTEVAEHYLKRALAESEGNKTTAAKLIGLSSYQTFTNWLQKYGVKE